MSRGLGVPGAGQVGGDLGRLAAFGPKSPGQHPVEACAMGRLQILDHDLAEDIMVGYPSPLPQANQSRPGVSRTRR